MCILNQDLGTLIDHIYILLAEHTEDIITLIFQYINMLKKDGIKEWIFEECRVSVQNLKHIEGMI